MIARQQVTLGLLAGGRGQRLGGVDKAFALFRGQTLTERCLEAAGQGFSERLISHPGNDVRFAAWGVRPVIDRRSGWLGPLAGLESLLLECRSKWLLTLPVDLRDIPADLVAMLLAGSSANGCVLADADGVQPLCGFWRVAAVSAIVSTQLDIGQRAAQALVEVLGLPSIDISPTRLGNLNTPQDFADPAMTDPHLERVGFDEAVAIIDTVAVRQRLPDERIPVSRGLGRILAADLTAGIDLPSFDNSAMDGFALAGSGTDAGTHAIYRLVGQQFAGRSLGLSLAPGECLRITTGAPLPAGADRVAIREEAVVDGEQVRITAVPAAGTHVRRAAEDVCRGEVVLRAGQGLTPARLGLAAALGQHDLPVSRRATVAIFTTGDELRPPGMALLPGEIHDSNRAMLQALLIADGYEPVTWPVLPDDPGRIAAALNDAALSFDVVLTCGGVSAGEKDYLPAILREYGCIHFWRVRMKPGMPVLFGQLGQAQVLALPGNPVSVFATYYGLVRRLLDGLQGREPRPRQHAILTQTIIKTHSRLEFQRGQCQVSTTGALQVTPDPATGSHRLHALSQANALIVLPEAPGKWSEGDVVEIIEL